MRRHRYLEYLMRKVRADTSYTDLCQFLLSQTFYWDDGTEPTDSNRAEDGKALRHLYFSETGYVTGMQDMPCSVLEMLVALSVRIEIDIMGEPGEDDPGRWFALMLRNLDIAEDVNGRLNERAVAFKIDKWMWRDFDADGRGSLFPLNEYPGDQRFLSIWDQMSFYLNEHY